MGEHRVRLAALFDAEIRPHNERFRAVAPVAPGDRVLDVGCGTGESTRDAARTAGSVLGVDVSAEALTLARRLSEDLPNVAYEPVDAQTHPFPAGSFDVCLSRFGVMFFAEPAAAFANLRRALRPGGRLAMLVWQAADRNEWHTAVRRAIGSPAEPVEGLRAFSLGDPGVVRRLLTGAGFAEVGFTEVAEPVYYGPDAETAYDLVMGFRSTREQLAPLDEVAAGAARARLRATLAEHTRDGGVFFGSRAWIVTAVAAGVR